MQFGSCRNGSQCMDKLKSYQKCKTCEQYIIEACYRLVLAIGMHVGHVHLSSANN